MGNRLLFIVVGSALAAGGCGSKSSQNDGGGTGGGAAGQGGAAGTGATGLGGGAGQGVAGADAGAGGNTGSAGGAAGGGTAGAGGSAGAGGASCNDLTTQYANALQAAQSCDLGAAQQCQQLVGSYLSTCSVDCMTYVNDPSALNAIRASWDQAGCDKIVVLCPVSRCSQPSNNMCLAGDGGRGTCSSNITPSCPSTPPLSGATCTGQDCYYEDCTGVGRTIALCHPEGTFEVHTTACTAPSCPSNSGGGASCLAGTLCQQSTGGTISDMCVTNTCGTGPISCDCLTSCAGTCSVSGNAQGINVSCNTCPVGQSCP